MLALSRYYWDALEVSLVFQIGFFFLAALMLDGGFLFQIWCYSMAAFWVALILIVCRRPHSPTKADLFLIRWGFPLIFPFGAALVAGLVWRVRRVL